jgi:hypothetical protein
MSTRKRSQHWIFGDGCFVTFENGIMEDVSPFPALAFDTREGCDTVSDEVTGELLFYTDGDSLYRFDHTVKTTNISGGLNTRQSIQSVTIVKQPGSSSTYFMFFVGDWGVSTATLYDIKYRTYNPVTDTLGSLVTRSSAGGGAGYAENITACLQSNNTDFWIITKMKGNNILRIWPLTSSGVGFPISRTVSFVYTGINRYGQIKVSPDGKKIALAMGQAGAGGAPIGVRTNSKTLVVWDFDDSNAQISNEITLLSDPTEDSPIGIDFSPNSMNLFCSSYFNKKLYRFTLFDNSTFHENVITPVGGADLGAIQIGPDDRIYVSRFGITPLVVNSPNDFESNISASSVSISGQCRFGLPVVTQIKWVPKDYRVYSGGQWWSVCDGDTIRLYDAGSASWKTLSSGDKYYDERTESWVTINCAQEAAIPYDVWDIVGFADPATQGYPEWPGSTFTLAKTSLSAPISIGTIKLLSTLYGLRPYVVQVTINGAYKDVIFQHTYRGTETGAKFLTPS